MTRPKAVSPPSDRASQALNYLVVAMTAGLRCQSLSATFTSKDHRRDVKIHSHDEILIVQRTERRRDPVLGTTKNLDRGVAMDAGIEDIRSALEWLEAR